MSIKLRMMANSVTRAINPNVTNADIYVNVGSETIAGGKVVPKYTKIVKDIQVQAIQSKDLEHLNLINQQGSFCYGYIDGIIDPMIRGLGTGLSYVEFGGVKWTVKSVVEDWLKYASGDIGNALNDQNGDWVKVVLWRK